MRLDRYLTLCDLGTRKQVKELIARGHVSVNEQISCNPGAAVDGPVLVDGKEPEYRPFVLILMNKPAGLLTATEDRKQKTVMDLLPERDRRRNPSPVGRLDKDTTGLLLITDDGQAAHALISPKSHVEKQYLATLDGPVGSAETEAFARGLELSDFTSLPARLIPCEGDQARVVLHEGKYHQVKRMFAAVGKNVLRLHRERIGSLTIPESLAEGEWMYLDLRIWNELREEAGLPPVGKEIE